MANKLNDWNQEKSSTTGTGDIILSGVISINQTRFRDGFNSENVYYSISDGANREAGIGAFNGTDRLVRSEVHSTLVNGVFNDTDPSPITLTGEAVVSGTFNTHAYNELLDTLTDHENRITVNESNITDIGGDISSLTSRVTANEGGITANLASISSNSNSIDQLQSGLTVLEDDVSYREVSITALEHGGAITQNGSTGILVAAGGGEIINSYDDPETPETEEITWIEQSVDLLAGGGMPVATGLGYTTIGVESAGTNDGASVIKFYPNGLSSGQRKVVVALGSVEYIDRVITEVAYEPVVSNQVGNVLMDLIDFMPSTSRIKGLVLRPTDGGGLTVWRDSGVIFGVGNNYALAKDNQNIRQVAAAGAEDTPIEFTLVSYNNGNTGVGATGTNVPEDAYEPGGAGTITSLTNGRTTIHYYMEATTGSKFVLYGQKEYATFDTAIASLFADRASHLFPAELGPAFLLGQMVIQKDQGVWLAGAAEVYPIDSSTSSGSSGGTSSQAVNISYSDTYNLGNNVQSAIDSLAALKLTPDQINAVRAAHAPTTDNEFVVAADIADMASSAEMAQAVGDIMSPLMSIPLKNSLTLALGVGSATFSRDSVATYINRYGVMQLSGLNDPRFEAQGLLVEAGSSNVILNSGAPTVFNSAIDETTDTQTLPDGITPAQLFTPDATVSAKYIEVQNIVADPSIGSSGSVFIRSNGVYQKYVYTLYGNSADNRAWIIVNLATGVIEDKRVAGEAVIHGAQLQALADGWYKLTVQAVVELSSSATIFSNRVQLLNENGENVFAGNGDGANIGMWQLEPTLNASSYIPSEGAAGVRAVESLSITGTENVSNDDFTVVFDYFTQIVSVPTTHTFISMSSGSAFLFRRGIETARALVSRYSSINATQPINLDGVSPNRFGISHNAQETVTFIPGQPDIIANTPTTRFPLSSVVITGGTANFHIANFRTFDTFMDANVRNLL